MMTFDRTHSLDNNDPSVKQLLESQARGTFGTATIGESREVMLTISGFKEFIRVVEGAEFEFGRFEYPEQNQLNLTPYGALEKGISRQHAKLYLMMDRLYIADMGSTNGTYVRGKMLQPAEPVMIRNGDEILLGRMRIKVQF